MITEADLKVKIEEAITAFTQTEQDQLHAIFNQPLVTRYLNSLSNNMATELMNITLSDMAADQSKHMLLQAFVKGNFNIVATLNTIRNK